MNQNRELTVVIPFRNEGIEVERTVENIRKTSDTDIILVNDGSEDDYDYSNVVKQYDCKYIIHTESKGVSPSREAGISLCSTKYFLSLDAHMEFYVDRWDLAVLSALKENPESIICMQTKVLSEGREKKATSHGSFGARLLINDKDMIKSIWKSYDPEPNSTLIEIPVVMGAAYAIEKEWWQRIHGLKGLCGYGLEEELMSMKCWIAGGRCMLLKDIEAGHIYREKFPYLVRNECLLKNRLVIVELFFEGETKKMLLNTLKTDYQQNFFDRIYRKMDWDFIKEERKYLKKISKKNLSYFLLKNKELSGL